MAKPTEADKEQSQNIQSVVFPPFCRIQEWAPGITKNYDHQVQNDSSQAISVNWDFMSK